MLMVNVVINGSPKNPGLITVVDQDILKNCRLENVFIDYGNALIKGNIAEKCKGDIDSLSWGFDTKKPPEGQIMDNVFIKCFFKKRKE